MRRFRLPPQGAAQRPVLHAHLTRNAGCGPAADLDALPRIAKLLVRQHTLSVDPRPLLAGGGVENGKRFIPFASEVRYSPFPRQ